MVRHKYLRIAQKVTRKGLEIHCGHFQLHKHSLFLGWIGGYLIYVAIASREDYPFAF